MSANRQTYRVSTTDSNGARRSDFRPFSLSERKRIVRRATAHDHLVDHNITTKIRQKHDGISRSLPGNQRTKCPSLRPPLLSYHFCLRSRQLFSIHHISVVFTFQILHGGLRNSPRDNQIIQSPPTFVKPVAFRSRISRLSCVPCPFPFFVPQIISIIRVCTIDLSTRDPGRFIPLVRDPYSRVCFVRFIFSK